MLANTLSPAVKNNYAKTTASISIFNRFMAWCGARQKDRMLWQALILGLHGCVITPIAMLVSLQAGAGSFLYVPVIVAIAMNLVPNLAALSTRITIPVFFLSLLIDIMVMVAALS